VRVKSRAHPHTRTMLSTHYSITHTRTMLPAHSLYSMCSFYCIRGRRGGGASLCWEELTACNSTDCVQISGMHGFRVCVQLSNDAASAELLASKQPSKTFATPEDIGELAAFLCSKAANQITGV
jgi:hypothetical protein